MIFDAFFTKSAGCWVYNQDEEKFIKGKKSHGYGIIKYPEGSIYYGDIYYDGENFNKLGKGFQDFSYSGIRYDLRKFSIQRYLYSGEYDYRKTDWIYGKGILYYLDDENKPLAHVPGIYSGLEKIDEAEVDEEVIEEFKNTPTTLPALSFASYIGEHINPKYMLIGDSYFDLFDNIDFAGDYKLENLHKDILNLGVCGYTYPEFIPLLDSMKKVQSVQQIYVNLGFNDLHKSRTKDEVFKDAKVVLKFLKTTFKDAKIGVLSVVSSPIFKNFLEEETSYNKLIEEYCQKQNFEFIDMREKMEEIDKEKGAFHMDNIHPNSNGYKYYAKRLFGYEN